MATAEMAEDTLTGPAESPVRTGALGDEGLVATKPIEVAFREAWRQMLEKVSMMRFVRYPDLEAEGLQPPTKTAIVRSLAVIQALANLGTLPPPMRVLPSGEGGIVFERWDDKENVERIEILSTGEAELSLFSGAKRIKHYPIS
jgi:hypothetical protein